MNIARDERDTSTEVHYGPGQRPSTRPERSRTIVIAVAVLGSLLLVAGCGVTVWRYFHGRDADAGANRTTPSTTKPSHNVDAAKVEAVLREHDYSCYETMTEPSVVRSCYHTANDGAQLAVRIQAGPGGETVKVAIKGWQSGFAPAQPRGNLTEPSTQIVTAISQVLLGNEATKVLKIEDGGTQRGASAVWGTVQFGLFPEGAFATFVKAGSKPLTGAYPLPVPSAEVMRRLGEEGFSCEVGFRRHCDKEIDGTSISAAIRKNEVSLTIWGAHPLTDALLRAQVEMAIGQLVSGADRSAATSWAHSNLNPDLGVVQGDAGGLHIEIAREVFLTSGREAAKITLQSAQPGFSP
ncbi:hypothetical protein [Actinopolymorpha alba]|uniref:hypothetical protein n=1 Tax=Actinopolymorpha alba TaxID=533267 RepID=UPI0012F6BEF0|nr:hypothetical protein [Actinopolymorpha alba]